MASLEQLFDRYRCRGDLEALGAVFDRTAPALLRIAAHLCGNRADAEDAVQATFVRAIEAAASFDASRPLTPWLVGILGNRVRHRRVLDARRPDPERLAAPAIAPDPEACARQRELDAAIAATIGGLPEAYRPVLQLHLRDGHDPAAIAASLARTPGTVRSQLARGLRALRRLLPPGFAAGVARAQLTACLPRMRAAVLARASAMPAVVASITPVLLAGIAMKKVVALVAVCAALFAGWLWWASLDLSPPNGSPTEEQARSPAQIERAASEPGPLATAPMRANGAPAPVERTSPPPDPVAAEASGALRLRVTHQADGSLAAGVLVFVTPQLARWRSFREWHAVTGADGVAFFAQLPVGWMSVATGRTSYGGEKAIEIAANAIAERSIVLGGVTVVGLVVDAADQPVPEARIVVVAGTRERELGRAGVDGRFALRGIGPEVLLGARATGFAPSSLQPVPPARDGSVGELRLALPGAGGSLACMVLGSDGAPVAEARVAIVAAPADGPLPREVEPWQLRPDPRGAVAFDGVGVGEVAVLAWAPGCAPWRGAATIAPAAITRLRIELQAGASLAGHVRDRSGQPLADCSVEAGAASSAAGRHYGRFAYQWTRTDAAGNYRLDGLPAGTVEAQASRASASVSIALPIAAGTELRWDPTLETTAAVVGRVVGADGRGIRATIEGHTRERPSSQLHAFTDETGRFTLLGASPGERVTVAVRVHYFPLAHFDGALPREGELVLHVSAEALASVRITGVVVDERDRPVPAATVLVLRRDHGVSPGFTTGDLGLFDAGPFPPGDYRLLVETEGRAQLRTPWLTAAPDARVDAGRLRLAPGGVVEVHLHAAAPPREPTFLEVFDASGESRGHVEIRSGSGRLQGLPAGRYTLQVHGQGLALARHQFEVIPPQCTRLDLARETGVPASITLRATGGELPKRVGVEIAAADGRVLLDRPAIVFATGKVSLPSFSLLPGDYRVTLRDANSAQVLGERSVAIAAGAAACDVEVVLGAR